MLTKCPYCGSTAQVKRDIAVPAENPETGIISIYYHCGCGCHFVEKFMHHSTEIRYLEDRKKF
jgi:hypothetical protein